MVVVVRKKEKEELVRAIEYIDACIHSPSLTQALLLIVDASIIAHR
jgi:hypothetical protein